MYFRDPDGIIVGVDITHSLFKSQTQDLNAFMTDYN